jgi:phosphoribosylamine--glycine ligase
MASGGYPGKYETGKTISGLDDAGAMKDVMVFHAGTALSDGRHVTAGGRVLGVTALGETISDAISLAYESAGKISWDGVHYRKDIGQKALRHIASQKGAPSVGIVMGSISDREIMEEAKKMLSDFCIPCELKVLSAHRSPGLASKYAKEAEANGIKVLIAGAGMAAHLAGALAAHTSLPVIGVPISSSPLNGLDALLSTVQMPPGVPVATMSIGKAGARNAAILAVQILALNDSVLNERLKAYKDRQTREIARLNNGL